MSLMLSRKHQGKVADIEVAAESVIGLFNMGRRHWILVIISASARRMTVLDPLEEVDEALTGLLSTWNLQKTSSNKSSCYFHHNLQYRLGILESIAKNQDSAIKELCRHCGCKMPPDWL